MRNFLFILFSLFFVCCNSHVENNTGELENTRSADSCCVKDSLSTKQQAALQSLLTCPKCGHQKMETMPTDVCLLSYTCEQCKAELRPKGDDCCVFCSYGSRKCPSMQ